MLDDIKAQCKLQDIMINMEDLNVKVGEIDGIFKLGNWNVRRDKNVQMVLGKYPGNSQQLVPGTSKKIMEIEKPWRKKLETNRLHNDQQGFGNTLVHWRIYLSTDCYK